MPTATAHRPSPVTRPPTKLMAPIIMRAASGHGKASCIAAVEASASAKPKPMVRAFSRQGAGRSEMLAEIAPSVAGWPAAKPKVAHATSATVITQTPTLKPLTICCPTSSLDRFGGRGQRVVKGPAPRFKRPSRSASALRPREPRSA